MTEIKLSNSSSPQKGTMEGQKARDLAIPRAFEEYQREADKKPESHLVIISDSEDEADSDSELGLKLDQLSLSPQALDLNQGIVAVKLEEIQYPNPSRFHYETSSPAPQKSTPTLPKYPAIATPPQKLTRRPTTSAQTATSILPQTPTHRFTTSTTSSVSASSDRGAPSLRSPAPAQATPGRRGKWNAYVVYSGRAPYVYRGWQGVRQLKDEDNNLVYKGFNDFASATQAWKAAHDTGVVDAIQKGQGRTHWVVTKGIEVPIAIRMMLSEMVWAGVVVFCMHSQMSRKQLSFGIGK
ncbi:hypothetical protein DFJ43DRAFT_1161520 [Lentinula guzmanii]|uniref:Ribonuclease H1 N-terminal domain-containing protein n=1 Tax=Lentinula guzmanii TaxID=2804957 RepID=A0AA38J281_9AGAR|nr:hypothetical protein DFJ43DRAFT_1161520 [Lentinula guzmanii]